MQAFQCRTCGECCYGEGGILVEAEELQRIPAFLGIPQAEFLSRYCEKRHGRLYVKTGPDNCCIFFHKQNQCLIHPVKPRICTLWPFFPAIVNDKDNWELAKEACPGINPHCSFEAFVKEARKSEE